MGFGKKDSSKKGKASGKKQRDNSGKRYFGSIWENGEFLNASIDNQEEDSEHNKGTLIWFDRETQKYYRVKSFGIFEPNKGPKNLTHKMVLDINNEYQVEEVEQD